MKILKKIIQLPFKKFGYQITKIPPVTFTSSTGRDAFLDMKRFMSSNSNPIILDVGANKGQSVEKFKAIFPNSIIHSFEPSPKTFKQLKKNISAKEGVFAWNSALGANIGSQVFLENQFSEMSSFLELGENGWGEITGQVIVDVITIDHFLDNSSIKFLDILKSDTQGFDFEVLKGAEEAIRNNCIGLIYLEINFSDIYKSLPSFDEIYSFLINRGFILVSIYEITYQNEIASFSDALFINKEYYLNNYLSTLDVPFNLDKKGKL